jgi:hypothetical protein
MDRLIPARTSTLSFSPGPARTPDLPRAPFRVH